MPADVSRRSDKKPLSPLSEEQRTILRKLKGSFASARASQGNRPVAVTRFPAVRHGVITGFPFTEYSEPVESFWALVGQAHLLAAPFDWSAWAGDVRSSGRDVLDPAFVAGLSSTDLRRYLTMLQRAERFNDGTWAIALTNGVFEMLIERLLELGLSTGRPVQGGDAES
jgi:hypothetical protein